MKEVTNEEEKKKLGNDWNVILPFFAPVNVVKILIEHCSYY